MYARQAVETIQQHNSSNPLFLMVSFQAPHNPFSSPPARYRRPYQ